MGYTAVQGIGKKKALFYTVEPPVSDCPKCKVKVVVYKESDHRRFLL